MPDLVAAIRILEGVVGLGSQTKLSHRRSVLFKRFMDYSGGLLFFILSAPVLLFFSLCIVITSPGNPFYSQVREGRGGKRFKVWKLRTMYPGADRLLSKYLKDNPEARKEWHTYFKLRNDPRVLKGIGTLLRRTSLDELPQLWNVLRGEMSLIGPRPFPHYHLEQFNKEFRELRRGVIPGMTGLWQVVARSDGNLAVQERLDTCYIRHWSIWLDVIILARTVLIVFSGKGAY
jgi:lipopolysaccharide/colanic/teichoic acid biosynthesis glycosyltransferase